MSAPDWDAVPPYTGPPQYPPVQHPPAQYPPPYGQPPYGQQWYGPPAPYPPVGWGRPGHPLRPRRPGPVIAAAVLAFASAVLVRVGTGYAAAFGALLSLSRGPYSGISAWFAVLQVAQAALLVVGGLRVLARDRRWLLLACGVQLALSAYWSVVLADLSPAVLEDSVLVLPVIYVVLAATAMGLPFLPDARSWTTRSAAPGDAGG